MNRPAGPAIAATARSQRARPRVVSRSEWLTARRELLAWEKGLTHARDILNQRRRALPAVRVERPYTFTGADGPASLADLFAGRSQLMVAHLMFAPGWPAACPGCSMLADSFGHLAHLHARDTTLAAVSRAPYPELARFADRMGWTFPWYSSHGGTFNHDFGVSHDEAIAPLEWNYRTARELRATGLGAVTLAEELPGVSVFLTVDGEVLYTYSTYARGLESLLTPYMWLDLTRNGRGEGWDGMPDLGGGTAWARHHDDYSNPGDTKDRSS